MKFKTIEYRFERNSLHEVGRVPSEFTVAKVIDHTAGVAAKQEPAVAGEMSSKIKTSKFINKLAGINFILSNSHSRQYNDVHLVLLLYLFEMQLLC